MAKTDEAGTEKDAAVAEQDAAKVATKDPKAAAAAQGKDDPGKTGGSGVDIDTLIENARAEGYERGFKEGKIEAEDEFSAALQGRENYPEDGQTEDTGDFNDDNEKMVVGMLLATVVRLPRSQRAGGLKPVLGNLLQFIAGYRGVERYIASNLILAIAETRPEEIANGAYRYDVENSLKLVRGEDETHSAVVDTARANREAADRFARIAKKNAPPPEAVDESGTDPAGIAAQAPEGDAQQKAAAARFYDRGIE